VLKLVIKFSLLYIFKHCDQNDSIFSVISKKFPSMTEKKHEQQKRFMVEKNEDLLNASEV